MPDFDQLDQCAMLARALWFLPGPARPEIAQGLYDIGIRVHPELATKNVMYTGPKGFGDHRVAQLVNINSARDGLEAVRQFAPDLYDRMQAAGTEQQKQQVLRDIEQKFPDIVAAAKQKVASARPEDLG